jgi:glycine/D-amino acid oxidase-like deaminating enzyme
MAATAPIAHGRLPCPVFARWGYDYAQQTPTGRMFLGGGRDLFADEEWTSAREPSAPVQEYIDEAALRFAGGPVTVTHRWAASVSYTPDARPLLTEVAPGVAACGAYSGTGNLIGTLAGRCAVELVVDGVPAPSFFAG